jgi:hypothetical protein
VAGMSDESVTITLESSGGKWTATATLNDAPDLTITGYTHRGRTLAPAYIFGEWRTNDADWGLAKVWVTGSLRNKDGRLGQLSHRIAWSPESSYSTFSLANAPDYVRAWVAEVEAGLPTIKGGA